MTRTRHFLLFNLATLFFFITAAQADMTYIKPVNITNPNGLLAEFQVLIPIDTSALITQGKLNSSCSDIRFLDSDMLTPIPYTLDGSCGLSNTAFWVKVPIIPAHNDKIIYVVYGDENAMSESNPEAVFDFFDDFSGASLNNDKWAVTANNGIPYSVGNGHLVIPMAGPPSRQIQIQSQFQYTYNTVVEQYTFLSNTYGITGRVGHAVHWYTGQLLASTSGISNGTSHGVGFPKGKWVYTKGNYIYGTNKNQVCNSSVCSDFYDTIQIISNDATILSIAALDHSYSSSSADVYKVDWVRVRKYASTELSVAVGDEAFNQTLFEDTDWDEMADHWEINYGLNPYDNTDAWEDPDGDGIFNRDEYLYSMIPVPIAVTWQNVTGVSIDLNSITKTVSSGWGNSGSASNETFFGNGYLEFTIDTNNTAWAAGLSHTNDSPSFDTISYALMGDEGGNLSIYEHGILVASFGQYQAGDHFAIKRENGNYYYQRNGVILYTSTEHFAGTLMADIALYTSGAQISNTVMGHVSSDSDGDIMANEWEYYQALDPNNATDGTLDNDSDTLTNTQEYQNGTEPYNGDSDWDQMPDAWELQYNLNPVFYNDAWEDPDGDGVFNRDEYLNGTNPLVSP